MYSIKKSMRYMIQDISLINKMMVLTISLITIPLIIIGCLYYMNVKSMIENEVSSTYGQMADQYVEGINYKTTLYSNLLSTITLSNAVQDALSKDEDNSYFTEVVNDMKITSTIDMLSLGNNYNEIKSLMIYVLDDSINFHGKYTDSIKKVESESWFNLINIKERWLQWATDSADDNNIILFKTISSIKPDTRLDLIGLTKLVLDKRQTFQVSDENTGGINNLSLFITDESGRIIFNNNKDNGIATEEMGNSNEDQPVYFNYDKKSSGIVISRDINFMGWKAVFVFPIQSIKDKIIKTILMTLISILLFGIFSITVIQLFSKFFTKRLRTLIKKMKEVKNGKLNIGTIIEGKDEIGVIDIHFNDMVAKLKESITENYVQTLARREAEIKALQFQINPHFLYNTLECIHSMALVHHCTDISNVALKLGDMMRYNISTEPNEYVTLGEEIKQVQNYIDIQKIRFGSRFEFFVDVPEELEDYPVLKFILQPLLENVIQHGFQNKREMGLVELTVYENSNRLHIKVEDDGVGITPERLMMINKKLKTKEEWISDGSRKSIGLQNVNSRIKLVHGEEYGIEVESLLDHWTTVTMCIPIKK